MEGHEVSTDHHKVPFWVGTDRKIISGISKSTTCEHVIRSLLSKSEDYSKFVIVEKWKKMERRLEPSAKILKVWKAWGDQKNEIALILRHHSSAADGYIDKKISNRVLRRKSSSSHHQHHHHQRKNSNEEKNVNSSDKHMTESMERLLKIVLTQGETIQAQLKKLRHQEDQIERFEHHIHQIRSLQDGENYVLDSYLHDERGKDKRSKTKEKNKRDKSREKSVSSSRGESSSYSNSIPVQKSKSSPNGPNNIVGTAAGSNSDPEIVLSIEQSEMLERICELNSKLTKEEERLVKLDFKVKKISEKSSTTSDNISDPSFSEEPNVENHHDCPVDTEEVCECDEFYLKVQLLSELETLRELTSDQSKEIELNEKNLTEMDVMLDLKHDELSNLTYQIQLVDEESQVLKSRLLQIGHGFLVHSYAAAVDLAEEKARNLNNINIPTQSPPEKIISSAPNLNFNLNVQPINYPLMSQASPSPQFQCNQPIQIAPQNVNSSLLNNSSEIIVVGPGPVDQDEPPPHLSITKSIINNNNSNNNSNSSTSKVDHHDNDSNSDTGISSLHSSGDENNFPLDTLV